MVSDFVTDIEMPRCTVKMSPSQRGSNPKQTIDFVFRVPGPLMHHYNIQNDCTTGLGWEGADEGLPRRGRSGREASSGAASSDASLRPTALARVAVPEKSTEGRT